MDPAQVGEGMVLGGWGYVWAVYGLTWTVFLGYTLVSLLGREP